ncbi:DUF397 domain-containing protein [Streptomyces sp. NPDC037389]|uniref:DUF397 domain-containing protein n=1 Tax=Streptomyces sp. NPDC037389 TaxID=3155369 RepID=UPI0033C80B80
MRSDITWQKSSYSEGGEQCVEIAAAQTHTIAIRESDAPSEVVTTTPHRFRALITGVRSGGWRAV